MAMASWADAMTASLEGASTGFLDDLKVAIEARDKRAIAWDNETNSMRRDLRHFEGIVGRVCRTRCNVVVRTLSELLQALPTPRTPAETVVSNNTAEQRIAPYAGPSTKAVVRCNKYSHPGHCSIYRVALEACKSSPSSCPALIL